jgi:hypothetical protein
MRLALLIVLLLGGCYDLDTLTDEYVPDDGVVTDGGDGGTALDAELKN